MPSSLLVRVVLGLLAIATAGAFFWTQHLKGEDPVVLRFIGPTKAFSPNGDGIRERVTVGFVLLHPATISFAIRDRRGRVVRTFVDDRRLAGDRVYRFVWNGRDASGRIVPDGVYRMRLVREDVGLAIEGVRILVNAHDASLTRR